MVNQDEKKSSETDEREIKSNAAVEEAPKSGGGQYSWIAILFSIAALAFSLYAIKAGCHTNSKKSDDERIYFSFTTRLSSFEKRLNEIDERMDKSDEDDIKNKITKLLLDVKGISPHVDSRAQSEMSEIEETLQEILVSGSSSTMAETEPIAHPLVAPAR